MVVPRHKPILLGLNNPLSTNPDDALVPWPAGSSGHRLFSCMRDVLPSFTIEDYMELFDRSNLLPSGTQIPIVRSEKRRLMRECGKRLRREVCRNREAYLGCDVVVLGRDAWEALYNTMSALRGVQVMESRCCIGVRWHRVPHPSGRSLWYNDEANRRAVGELLLALVGGRS